MREKHAREGLKKLQQIKSRMATIDTEILAKRQELKPFEYPTDVVSAMKRQEIRAHIRTMNEDQRRTAMRTFEYRQAVPELSGLSPTQHQAAADESLHFRFPDQLAALDEARAALEIAQTAHETVQLALENEIKATGATVQEASSPEPIKPWI